MPMVTPQPLAARGIVMIMTDGWAVDGQIQFVCSRTRVQNHLKFLQHLDVKLALSYFNGIFL